MGWVGSDARGDFICNIQLHWLLWARRRPYFLLTFIYPFKGVRLFVVPPRLFMSCYDSKGLHLFVVSPRLLDQKVENHEWSEHMNTIKNKPS